MRRSRWLAVAVRADIPTNKIDESGAFVGVHRFSWDHPMYRCAVPDFFSHQLVLSRHLQNIYGSIEYLPVAKRIKLGNSSMSDVLRSRVLSPDEIMPTLCAMYTQQHELAPAHLCRKGIFAPLTIINDGFAFIDPVRFISLLGMPTGFFNALPAKIDVAFHQLGNARERPTSIVLHPRCIRIDHWKQIRCQGAGEKNVGVKELTRIVSSISIAHFQRSFPFHYPTRSLQVDWLWWRFSFWWGGYWMCCWWIATSVDHWPELDHWDFCLQMWF